MTPAPPSCAGRQRHLQLHSSSGQSLPARTARHSPETSSVLEAWMYLHAVCLRACIYKAGLIPTSAICALQGQTGAHSETDSGASVSGSFDSSIGNVTGGDGTASAGITQAQGTNLT